MDEAKEIRTVWMEDGREAERHTKVVQEGEDCCSRTKVTELYAEPKPQKKLVKRVVERERPVVCERTVEEVDDVTGEVIDQWTEKFDVGETHKVVERIQPVSVVAQATAEEKKFVTKEDLQDALLTVARVMSERQAPESEPECVQQMAAPVEPQVSMQQVVGERVEQSKGVSVINLALAALIAAQVGVLGYLLFFV